MISKILTGNEPNIAGALTALDEKYNAALDAAVANGKVVLSDYIDPDIAEKMQPVK